MSSHGSGSTPGSKQSGGGGLEDTAFFSNRVSLQNTTKARPRHNTQRNDSRTRECLASDLRVREVILDSTSLASDGVTPSHHLTQTSRISNHHHTACLPINLKPTRPNSLGKPRTLNRSSRTPTPSMEIWALPRLGVLPRTSRMPLAFHDNVRPRRRGTRCHKRTPRQCYMPGL